MKIPAPLFLLLCLSITLTAQQNWDFKADSLYVVWGAKNYSGKEDCSAKARMTSTDSSVIIEVEVTDDRLVFNDDPLNSDHIELWFAIPSLYRERSRDNYYHPDNVNSYLFGNASYLYLYKMKSDLEAFKNEIKSPLIQGHDAGMDSMRYDELQTDNYYNWLKDDVDNYLAEARSASLKKSYVFYGIVHLGVLPKDKKTLMYDKEAYQVFQKQANIQIPDYSQFMKTECSIGPNGYRLKIVLPPQAIGFTRNDGLQEILFLANVVDCDVPGKQATLLSISQIQKWGEPATFNRIRFRTDVRVPIFPKFPIFGTSIHDESAYSDLRDLLSDIFIFTTDGWVPLDRECAQFYVYNQPEIYWLPNIQKVRFLRGKLDYKEKRLGRYNLGYLSTSSMEYLVVEGKSHYPMKNVLSTFLLPDGSLGLITTEYDITGRYTRSMQSQLFLIANNIKTQIAEYYSCCPSAIRFTDSLKIESKEWDTRKIDWSPDDDKNGDWSKLITLDIKGRFLIVDLGNKQRVKIQWNENGGDVKFHKM